MVMEKSKKKYGFDKIFILAMAVLSLAGAVLFFFTEFMLPIPLAELVSVGVYYGVKAAPEAQSITAFILCCVLYFLTEGAMIMVFFSKKALSMWIKLPLSLVFIVDFILHTYAFLFASGYGWNYLAAAAFDVLVIAAIYYENKNIYSNETPLLTKDTEAPSESHNGNNDADVG